MYEVSKIMNELSYLCSIRSSVVLVLFKLVPTFVIDVQIGPKI